MSPSTPAFFDDLGSLDPSLYTTIAEVGLTEMGVGVSKECFPDLDLLLTTVLVQRFRQKLSTVKDSRLALL